jgi:hypothetical protein
LGGGWGGGGGGFVTTRTDWAESTKEENF